MVGSLGDQDVGCLGEKGNFEVGKGWNDIIILHKGGRGACQKRSLQTKNVP